MMLRILVVALVACQCSFAALDLDEGESCGPSNKWTCLNITKCLSAQRDLIMKIYPPLCSIRLSTPIVCCEPEMFTYSPLAPIVENVVKTTTPVPPLRKSLVEGDSCGPSNSWTCRQISDCESALDDSEDEHPTMCAINNGVVIVCCRPPSAARIRPPVKQSIAKKMCQKYAQFVFGKQIYMKPGENTAMIKVDKCAMKKEPLIVGGMNAKLHEFPHMAHIGANRNGIIMWMCGGSLISDRWILTAAHCLIDHRATHVRLGELDTSSELDGARPEIFSIEKWVIHPDWTYSQLYNDIALIKLNSTVVLTPYIRPVCLQVDASLPPYAVASGWGTIDWEGPTSSVLLKVFLKIINGTRCNKQFGARSSLPNGIWQDKQLCTWGEGTRDTCRGDSGGPLQIPLTEPYCMYSQIGVTSFGIECASSFPGVYTNVSTYVPWIESVVWPDLIL